jgi:hypothetical protein
VFYPIDFECAEQLLSNHPSFYDELQPLLRYTENLLAKKP